MDNSITVTELVVLLAIMWLPIFAVFAVLHWQLLAGRRWRGAWVTVAFVVGIIAAIGLWVSPVSRVFIYLGSTIPFLAVGGIPIQAALLSGLVVTLSLLLLHRRRHR